MLERVLADVIAEIVGGGGRLVGAGQEFLGISRVKTVPIGSIR